MTSVAVTTLSNGLRVASDTMSSVETASVGVWIETGSRFEPAPLNGVSHLLEHMMFKGTPTRDARAIAEEIEAVGGHMNAHTSREYTAYYARVLAEDIGLAVDLVADLLLRAAMDDEELRRERTVILQEIMQAEDTPEDIIFDRFQETAFPDQALGRPILGSPERVGGMSRDSLIDYWRRHYAAPRMIVAAAGKVDHDALVALVENAFLEVPTVNGVAAEPAHYAGGEWRKDRDLEQVNVILGFPAVGFDDPDYYVQSVLSTILGGGMSSRLFQEVREKRGLVYSIYSFASSYRDSGLFGVYAGTGADEVAELIPVVCGELVGVAERVHAKEIARARAQVRASLLMASESTSARCEQLARQLMVFGRPIPNPEILSRIEAVTAEDVMHLAGRLFSRTPTLAALGPVGKLEPTERIIGRLAA